MSEIVFGPCEATKKQLGLPERDPVAVIENPTGVYTEGHEGDTLVIASFAMEYYYVYITQEDEQGGVYELSRGESSYNGEWELIEADD